MLRRVRKGAGVFLILLIAAAAILTGSGSKAMETAPELRFDEHGNLVPVPDGIVGDAATPPGSFDLAALKAGLSSGAPSNGVPSFMDPCGDARRLPSGKLRHLNLSPLTEEMLDEGSLGGLFQDTRDICEGAPCPGNTPTHAEHYWSNEMRDGMAVSGRPHTFFDQVLHDQLVAIGESGQMAIRRSFRTLACYGNVKKWRGVGRGSIYPNRYQCAGVDKGKAVEHRGIRMLCNYYGWEDPTNMNYDDFGAP